MIKGWLPAADVKKIKFVAKASIGEFVRAEDSLKEWGGEFVHENRFDPGPEATTATTEINVEDKDGETPLQVAVSCGHENVAELLIAE